MTTINETDYHTLAWGALKHLAKERGVNSHGLKRDALIERLRELDSPAIVTAPEEQSVPALKSLPASVCTMRANTQDALHIFSASEQCTIAMVFRKSPPNSSGERKMTSYDDNARNLAAAFGYRAALLTIAEALDAGARVDPEMIRAYLAGIDAQKLPQC